MSLVSLYPCLGVRLSNICVYYGMCAIWLSWIVLSLHLSDWVIAIDQRRRSNNCTIIIKDYELIFFEVLRGETSIRGTIVASFEVMHMHTHTDQKQYEEKKAEREDLTLESYLEYTSLRGKIAIIGYLWLLSRMHAVHMVI